MKEGQSTPTISVPLGDPKPITFIYPYYDNPKMLAYQLDHWNGYPEEIKRYLTVIIVDDGSPTTPAETVLRQEIKDNKRPQFLFKLFRITIDVRWNQHAARNIGMHEAEEGWCLMSDIDHVVPVDTFKHLVLGQHDLQTAYRFSRKTQDGKTTHPHPNSWFMTRTLFWKIGGYDEALAGFYGTDSDFYRQVIQQVPLAIFSDPLLKCEGFLDSYTTGYKRNQPEDAQVKSIIAQRGKGWKPTTLSYPWKRIVL